MVSIHHKFIKSNEKQGLERSKYNYFFDGGVYFKVEKNFSI